MPTQTQTRAKPTATGRFIAVQDKRKSCRHASVFFLSTPATSAEDQRKVTQVAITPNKGLKDLRAGGQKLLQKQKRREGHVECFYNLLATRKISSTIRDPDCRMTFHPLHPSAAAPAKPLQSPGGHTDECTRPHPDKWRLFVLLSGYRGAGPIQRRVSVTTCNEIRPKHFNEER